jgi:hypothetical protein
MPVKVNIGLSKKVGLPEYGSAGASCHVEFELDGGYDNGSTDKFQDAVRRAYVACRTAVESELAAYGTNEGSTQGVRDQALSTNRIPNRSASESPKRGATSSQVRAIHAIANRNDVDLADILSQFNATRPDDLSIRDASTVIDRLKNPSGSPAVRR